LDRIKVGIIGCGALGITHTQRFAAIPGMEVAALSDPYPQAIDRAAAELATPPALKSTDYHDLLDAGLDAVCIASPDAFHIPQVMDSLAAGLHVLCEKPLTPDSNDLEAVIASCEETGKVVSMTYPRRYDAGIRAIRDEIKSGRWGGVRTISIYNAEDWVTPNAGTWRHDPEICPGGFFYDASGHQLDTVQWITGLSGKTVRAESSNRGTPIPLVVWGTAKLTGGVPMTFTFVGDAHAWREQINIHTDGMDFVIQNGHAHWLQDGKMTPMVPGVPEETADEAFVRHLRGEGPNWAPPEELWPVLTFTRAALASAASGKEETV
jgi:predicted dehydrogenase